MKEEGGTLLGDKGVRRHQVSASTLNIKENTNEIYKLNTEYLYLSN